MDSFDGEPRRSDGQPCPPLQKLRKANAEKRKSETLKSENQSTGSGAVMAENQALEQFLQALFKWVTTAILVFLAGGVGTSEILHPFTHAAGGGHKTDPITNTTRREDRGETGVEIQQVEGEDDGGGATGNGPDSEGTGLVPCEALGVGCLNRVPSGFCHFRKHLCVVAPHPDRQPAGGVWAEILPELRTQRDFLDRLVSGQEKILVQLPLLAEGHPAAQQPEPRHEFCLAGDVWDVTFDGGRMFHLRRTLGVEYLNYLLHRPGEVISAFDLETTIRPVKAGARAKDSIQTNLDADAVRDYLRQLDQLRAQREEAAEDGDLATADRLDDDITAIELELTKNRQAPDAGERARDNVRKAIVAVQRKLLKGNAHEQNFSRHLEQFISLGYMCSYHQPPGVGWT